jgi:hypothetical protein
MTKIVNCKDDAYDVYIGRPSIWGNPFIIPRDGNRKEVIEKYYQYLRNNEYLLSEIHKLDGKVLGCWCKPKKCHGDVIIQVLEELKIEGFINRFF